MSQPGGCSATGMSRLRGLPGGGGGLDEEAAFEDGLEDLEEGFAAAVEAVAEAFLGLAEDVVEVGADEGVVGAAEDGEEDAVFAGAGEEGALLGKFVSGFDLVLLAAEFADEHAEGGLDPPGGGVPGGVVAGVGDEALVALADEVDLLDLEAAGAVEDDLVIAAAGEEGAEAPGEAIDGADFAELPGGVHLFGESPADGAAKHWLQISVDAGLGGVEGFGEAGFEDGKEGVLQVIVGVALVGGLVAGGGAACGTGGFELGRDGHGELLLNIVIVFGHGGGDLLGHG